MYAKNDRRTHMLLLGAHPFINFHFDMLNCQCHAVVFASYKQDGGIAIMKLHSDVDIKLVHQCVKCPFIKDISANFMGNVDFLSL